MRKNLLLAGLILTLALVLTACSSSGLSDAFDEDAVLDKAHSVVETINTKDYTAVCALIRADLQDQITPEQLEAAWGEQLEAAGAFTDFGSVSLKDQTDSATGEDYAVVVLEAKYENSTLIYTLSFDTDLELVGLYMK